MGRVGLTRVRGIARRISGGGRWYCGVWGHKEPPTIVRVALVGGGLVVCVVGGVVIVLGGILLG